MKSYKHWLLDLGRETLVELDRAESWSWHTAVQGSREALWFLDLIDRLNEVTERMHWYDLNQDKSKKIRARDRWASANEGMVRRLRGVDYNFRHPSGTELNRGDRGRRIEGDDGHSHHRAIDPPAGDPEREASVVHGHTDDE